jgi:hypothetical protein
VDQNTIDAIYRNYPWATEDTLRMVYLYTNRDDTALDNELKRILAEFKNATAAGDAGVKNIRSIFNLSKQSSAGITNTLKVMTNDTSDTVGGMIEMIDFAGKAGSAIGGGLQALGGGSASLFGSLLTGLGGLTTASVATGTALSTYAIKLAADADAELKQAINLGAVEGDLSKYTNLRMSASNLGLSFKELVDITGSSSYVMKRFGTSIIDGTDKFARFTARLRYDKEFSRFGYTTEQLTKRLADEVVMLNGVTGVDDLDSETQKAIIDSFEQSTHIATMLASATGDNRDRLLDQRAEALKDIDFLSALSLRVAQDARFVDEESQRQLKKRYAVVDQALGSILPDNLLGTAREIMKSNIANGGNSDEIMDDLYNHPDFAKFISAAAEASPTYVDALVEMLSFPITGIEKDSREALVLMKKANAAAAQELSKVGQLGANKEIEAIIDVAALGILNNDRIRALNPYSDPEKTATVLDKASAGINVVDDARVAYVKTIEKVKPGYDKISSGLKLFTDALYNALGMKTPEERATEYASSMNSVLDRARNNSVLSSELKSIEAYKAWLNDPANENKPLAERQNKENSLRIARKGIYDSFGKKELAKFGIGSADDVDELTTILEKQQTYSAKDGMVIIENKLTRASNTFIQKDVRNDTEILVNKETGNEVPWETLLPNPTVEQKPVSEPDKPSTEPATTPPNSNSKPIIPSSEPTSNNNNKPVENINRDLMRQNAQVRIAQAMNFFLDNGWSKQQAAGIVGNLQVESYAYLDHTAVGDGGQAYGIAQWHPARQNKFKEQYGKPIQESTFEEQLNYVQWELTNSEVGAGNILKKAKTASEAAIIVDKYYERSAGNHRDLRERSATRLVSGDYHATQRPDVDTNTVPESVPPTTPLPEVKPDLNDENDAPSDDPLLSSNYPILDWTPAIHDVESTVNNLNTHLFNNNIHGDYA